MLYCRYEDQEGIRYETMTITHAFTGTKTIHVKRYRDGWLASLDGGEYIPTPFTSLAPVEHVYATLGRLHPNADMYEVEE